MTVYNNDDIMQEIDELHVKVDNINEQLGLMMKFIEGLQSQLGNEVDALAKLEKTNFKEPKYQIINNVTAKVERGQDKIKDLLIKQIFSTYSFPTYLPRGPPILL